MILRLFFIFLLFCTSNVHAGVLDRLDEVGDAVKPGSKESGSSTGEMPDGPADEKFSDFVKRARRDMEQTPSKPSEVPTPSDPIKKSESPPEAPEEEDRPRKKFEMPAMPPPPGPVKKKPYVPAELPEEKDFLLRHGLPPDTNLAELTPAQTEEMYSLPSESGEIPGVRDGNFPPDYSITPQELEAGEKPKEGALKEAHDVAKGVKYGAKGLGAVPPFKEGIPELENISKGAGKAADALKGARAVQEIREGKRTGASKAAELTAKYGAGKAAGILAKPVTGAVETAAQGMDKVNSTLDNPTEENSAETIRHVEGFQYEAAKNTGVDVKKLKEKVGGWKDWYYDQVYKFAPGWIPDKEKTKRDIRSLSTTEIDPSIFEKANEE